jgi:gliding motility-associated lipoprotein GldD
MKSKFLYESFSISCISSLRAERSNPRFFWIASSFLLAITAHLTSCSSDYSPKPKGYFYIDLPEPAYRDLVNYPYFKCSISNQILVEELKNEQPGKEKIEFNLNYPRFQAKIYCTYFRMNPTDFPGLSDDCRRMAYSQEKTAKNVAEVAYSHPEQKVYGLVYEIEGAAASPIQFVLTDSVHSFLRGALYFDTAYNRDSIAPVLAYINKDIHVMMESFQWKQ